MLAGARFWETTNVATSKKKNQDEIGSLKRVIMLDTIVQISYMTGRLSLADNDCELHNMPPPPSSSIIGQFSSRRQCDPLNTQL